MAKNMKPDDPTYPVTAATQSAFDNALPGLVSGYTRNADQIEVRRPLELTEALTRYDVTAKIQGGGVSGQAGALRHGIARALEKLDPNQRLVLKRAGFLTRDPRRKERKKYGQKGARARFQFSKR